MSSAAAARFRSTLGRLSWPATIRVDTECYGSMLPRGQANPKEKHGFALPERCFQLLTGDWTMHLGVQREAVKQQKSKEILYLELPKSAAVSEIYLALQQASWVSKYLNTLPKNCSLRANQIQQIGHSFPGTNELQGSRMALSGAQPAISPRNYRIESPTHLQASRCSRVNFSSHTLTLRHLTYRI